MFAKDNLLFQLTTEEQSEVKSILKDFSTKFDSIIKEYGVTDMAPLFCNLLGEMINFSLGDKSKSPEAFKAVLKYHYGDEGAKFYTMVVKIFSVVFEKWQNTPVALVKIAVQLKLVELLKEAKNEDIMVKDGDLFFRRKRKL